jgi:hypothetical protein
MRLFVASPTRYQAPMLRLILSLVLLLSAALPGRGEPVFPQGLQTGLEPAGDLRAEPGFAGFRDAERHVNVVIAELAPAAYQQLADSMFGKGPPGATKVTREAFPFNEGVGYLHIARGIENGTAFRRWILIAKPIAAPSELLNFMAVVNVTVPDSASKVYTDAVVRKMLASVSFRAPPIEERLKLIPFTLSDFAGFRAVQVLPEGLILTDGPHDDISRQPSMIVSIGRAAPEQMADHERFARDLLGAVPVRDLTMTSAEELRIGGRPGFEIRARGKDAHGEPLSLVQWVRFTGAGFVRVVGVSASAQWDATFNRFRAVRDGVELR